MADEYVDDGECLEIRRQLVNNDPNLTSLTIGYGGIYPLDGDWAGLGRDIGRNTHLNDLCVSPDARRRMPEEVRIHLFRGLASNRSIQKLTLRKGDGNWMDDEVANILANGIIQNAPLKELDIYDSNYRIQNGWQEIFTILRTNENCRLEKLNLSNSNINEGATLSLSRMLLRHGATLKTLNLRNSMSNNLSIFGWQALLQPLQDPIFRLEKLDLSRNYITDADEVVAALSNALANNSRLRELDLSYNSDVTATGWEAFSTVLRNPNTALEKVDMIGNHITDHVMIMFADALATNIRLRELHLVVGMYSVISQEFCAAFTHILCNNSSIVNTYRSNHTLGRLLIERHERFLPEDLRSLLRINRENTEIQAARLKIIRTHFSGSNIDLTTFIDAKTNILPHAIAWMARDDAVDRDDRNAYGMSLMYRFFCAKPTLLERN